MTHHQKLAAVLEEMGLKMSPSGSDSAKQFDRRFVQDTTDNGRLVRETLTLNGSRGHGFVEFAFGQDGNYLSHEVYIG